MSLCVWKCINMNSWHAPGKMVGECITKREKEKYELKRNDTEDRRSCSAHQQNDSANTWNASVKIDARKIYANCRNFLANFIFLCLIPDLHHCSVRSYSVCHCMLLTQKLVMGRFKCIACHDCSAFVSAVWHTQANILRPASPPHN